MKKVLLSIVLIFILASVSFADSWVQDAYNWKYEEKGNFVRNAWRRIDGINYYFDNNGNWIPSEMATGVALKSKELYTFSLSEEYGDKTKLKTIVTFAIPIVEGENAPTINNFIRDNIVSKVRAHVEDVLGEYIGLIPKISIPDVEQTEQSNGVVRFTYRGDLVFNVYVDTKNLNLWVTN